MRGHRPAPGVRDWLGALRHPATLAGRLTRTLVLWVGGVWLLCVVGVVWYTDREINHNFDSELIEVSHRMFDIALDTLDEAPPGSARPLIAPPPAAFRDAAVSYQIVDTQSHVLVRSADTSAQVFDVPLATGFADTRDWRIYTVRHPSRPLYLQVADPQEERSEVLGRTIYGLLLPLVAVLPLLSLLLWRIARDELRALQILALEISRRSGSQLQPIALHDMPRELERVGDDVNHLLERLAHALDVERALAANAAHELRTPLAAARLRLHTALDEPAGDAQQAHVRAALLSLETLAQRAEKLLQLSRAESGGALSRSSVDLGAVAAAVAEEFWSATRDARHIDVAVDEKAQAVNGDADALAIALRNLVENALRHGAGAPVEIQVAAPSTLIVRDAGPGVAAEAIDTLVQRHVRQGDNRTGYGLGLSIVSTIVAKHGGRLELQSPPPGRDRGLEARIVLPPATTTG